MRNYTYKNQIYGISRDGVVFKNDTILSQYDNGLGYRTVVLSGKPHYIHKLIGLLYVPNPDNKRYVVHKNKIIQDNRVSNLEWRASSEIIMPEERRLPKQIIISFGYTRCATPINQIDSNTDKIIKLFASQLIAAKAMGVHPKSIWSALNKPHLCKGYKWTYA